MLWDRQKEPFFSASMADELLVKKPAVSRLLGTQSPG